MATHKGKDWSGGQATQVLRVVDESGILREKLQAVLNGGYLSDLLWADLSLVPREKFREALGLAALSPVVAGSVRPKFPTYPLSVNYDRSVADGIAAGKYDWVIGGFGQEYFPTKRTGTSEVDVYLVHFGWEITSARLFVNSTTWVYVRRNYQNSSPWAKSTPTFSENFRSSLLVRDGSARAASGASRVSVGTVRGAV